MTCLGKREGVTIWLLPQKQPERPPLPLLELGRTAVLPSEAVLEADHRSGVALSCPRPPHLHVYAPHIAASRDRDSQGGIYFVCSRILGPCRTVGLIFRFGSDRPAPHPVTVTDFELSYFGIGPGRSENFKTTTGGGWA
jgi:hypothetical protein